MVLRQFYTETKRTEFPPLFFLKYSRDVGVWEDITGKVMFQCDWTKEDSALAPSLNFIVMCSFTASIRWTLWTLSSILSHTPREEDITALPAHTFIPSMSPHFCKSLWVRTSIRSLSVDVNAKTPRSVASVFSWERGRPILPQPGHGGGIPLFLFLFSPCAPSSDPNMSGLACRKARTRTGAWVCCKPRYGSCQC